MQVAHVKTEEPTVYPQIRKHLKSRDWQTIREQAMEIDDSMFEVQATGHFPRLSGYPIRELDEHEPAATHTKVTGCTPKRVSGAHTDK